MSALIVNSVVTKQRQREQ